MLWEKVKVNSPVPVSLWKLSKEVSFPASLITTEILWLDRVLTLLKKGYISKNKINKIKYSYKLTPKYLEAYNKLTPLLNSHP